MTAMPVPQIDIDSLDTEQRLRLIEQLWDSLSVKPEAVPMTEEQKAELDRRLDEIDAGSYSPGLVGRLRASASINMRLTIGKAAFTCLPMS